jgi:hypothetical protein
MRACACTRALHLLSAVLPYPVTAVQLEKKESRARLRYSGSGPRQGKDQRSARAMIAADAEVTSRWIPTPNSKPIRDL